MSESLQVQVLLRPDGGIIMPAAASDPAARWQVVGQTRRAGELVSFVRAQIAGASWATTIPTAWLSDKGRGAIVTLSRQTPIDQVPLTGWILFC
jgi:hypothetical protein